MSPTQMKQARQTVMKWHQRDVRQADEAYSCGVACTDPDEHRQPLPRQRPCVRNNSRAGELFLCSIESRLGCRAPTLILVRHYH